METIETLEYKGHTIKVHVDEYPDDPRNWDNLGKMVCFHRSYNLGDKHSYTVEEAKEIEAADNVVSLPLHLYDHSGLRMKVGSFRGLLPQGHAEFDSGCVGFIYVTKEQIKEEYSVKKISKRTMQRALGVLEAEVKTYDEYLSGSVLAYVVEKAGVELDSCSGFYGGMEYILSEARSTVDHYEAKECEVGAQIEAFIGRA